MTPVGLGQQPPTAIELPALAGMEAHVSEERGALIPTFTELVAEAGPGIPLSAGRKNCIVSSTLGVLAGWQYTLGATYLRGFVALEARVREPFSTSAFFAGAGATGRFQSTKNGPYEGELVVSDADGVRGAALVALRPGAGAVVQHVRPSGTGQRQPALRARALHRRRCP